MNFTMSEKQAYWRDRVIAFMNEHVYPAEATYDAQMEAFLFGPDAQMPEGWTPEIQPTKGGRKK